MKLQITMSYAYPSPRGRSGFVDRSGESVHEVDVLLADPAVKRAYWSSWKSGVFVGLSGTIVGGLMLAFFAFGMRTSGGVAPQQEVVCDDSEARAERLAAALD